MSIANKLLTIAENIPRVYNSGVTEGYREGAKYQHKSFWDNYQDYGKRNDYTNAFSGTGWTNETFKPNHDMKPFGTYMMFKNSKIEGDLVDILNKLNVTLDFSICDSFQYTFQNTKFTRVGYIKATRVRLVDTFQNSALLETIDGLELATFSEDHTSNTFSGCTALKNLTIYGTLGNSFNVKDCPLTRVSIDSIFDHLSTTATGKTLTLNENAVKSAYTDEEWATRIAPFSNWTITLVKK